MWKHELQSIHFWNLLVLIKIYSDSNYNNEYKKKIWRSKKLAGKLVFFQTVWEVSNIIRCDFLLRIVVKKIKAAFILHKWGRCSFFKIIKGDFLNEMHRKKKLFFQDGSAWYYNEPFKLQLGIGAKKILLSLSLSFSLSLSLCCLLIRVNKQINKIFSLI